MQFLHTDTLCLVLLNFTYDRHQISYHLFPESGDRIRCETLSLAAHIANLHKALHTKAVCLLGTVLDKLIEDLVKFSLIVIEKFAGRLIGRSSYFLVRTLHIWSELGKIVRLSLKFDLRPGMQSLLLGL